MTDRHCLTCQREFSEDIKDQVCDWSVAHLRHYWITDEQEKQEYKLYERERDAE